MTRARAGIGALFLVAIVGFASVIALVQDGSRTQDPFIATDSTLRGPAGVGSSAAVPNHAPIAINGDAQLAAFPDKTGSGTAADPYVIRDLVINGGGDASCFSFAYTKKYIDFINCTAICAGASYYGFYGYAIQNVQFKGCTAMLSTNGIDIEQSRNINITDCTFENIGHGIDVYLSCLNFHIRRCTIRNFTEKAITVQHCSNAAGSDIMFNEISGTIPSQSETMGIYVRYTNGLSIASNSFTSCGNYGAYAWNSNDLLFTQNWISNNTCGLLFRDSPSGIVVNNSFVNNTAYQARVLSGVGTRAWHQGGIGNYWGDYSIRYPSATNDNTTWNTPYVVNATCQDDHPLVHPHDVPLPAQIHDYMPTATFTPEATTAIANSGVWFWFTGYDGNAPAMFQWNFGDGPVNSTLESPNHVYATTGTYSVTVTITDADGDTNTFNLVNCIAILPDYQPVASITPSAVTITPGSSVTFTYSGTEGNAPASFLWWCGGVVSGYIYTRNCIMTFPNTGYHQVSLRVTDSDGDACNAFIRITVTTTISPDSQPVANFSANATRIFARQNVAFIYTGTSGNGLISYQWCFNDGSANDTRSNPVHQFNTPGDFSVRLMVVDQDGDASTTTFSFPITVIGFPYHAQIAINGDAQLDAFPDKTGSGTAEDPYVIQDFIVMSKYYCDNEPPFSLKNTRKYVDITNCTALNTTADDGGFSFEDVENVQIKQCTAIRCRNGIYIRGSRNVNVIGCVIEYGECGVSVENYSVNVNVHNCNITNTTQWGIMWMSCPNAYGSSVMSNNISGIASPYLSRGHGIYVSASNGLLISSNSIWGCKEYGIYFWFSEDTTITRNWISSNNRGIMVRNVPTGVVYNNTFVNNTNGHICIDPSVMCVWNDHGIGNYWSDYIVRYPAATNNNVTWNTPYMLYGTQQDKYPLVQPHDTPYPPNQYDLITTASFTMNATTAIANSRIAFTFTGNVGNAPASFDWNFGDGLANSTLQSPIYTFRTTGIHTITVTITDADGDTSTFSRPECITILPDYQPVANFTSSATTVCPGSSVTFTYTGTEGNSPLSLGWYLYGSNVSYAYTRNPTVTYPKRGIYSVILYFADVDGDHGTLVRSNYINVTGTFQGDLQPVADFSANVTRIIAGQCVSFSYTGTEGNSPLTFRWTFHYSFYYSTTRNPVYRFTSAGTFTISLTVTDADGNTSSVSKNNYIVVTAGNVDLQPIARFCANTTNIITGQDVAFTYTGTNGDGLTSYQWCFADGDANNTSQYPVHRFSTPGSFLVKLTVIDRDGDVSTFTLPNPINVDSDIAPIARFTTNATLLMVNQSVQFNFTGSEGNSPATFKWDFGDGTACSAQRNPSHRYARCGVFTVTLEVVDRDGDKSKVIIPACAVVLPRVTPLAKFSVLVSPSGQNHSVQFTFTGNKGNGIASFEWAFGDGSISGEEDPVHIYSRLGEYNVTLTVTDIFGNSACVSHIVSISAASPPLPEQKPTTRYESIYIPIIILGLVFTAVAGRMSATRKAARRQAKAPRSPAVDQALVTRHEQGVLDILDEIRKLDTSQPDVYSINVVETANHMRKMVFRKMQIRNQTYASDQTLVTGCDQGVPDILDEIHTLDARQPNTYSIKVVDTANHVRKMIVRKTLYKKVVSDISQIFLPIAALTSR